MGAQSLSRWATREVPISGKLKGIYDEVTSTKNAKKESNIFIKNQTDSRNRPCGRCRKNHQRGKKSAGKRLESRTGRERLLSTSVCEPQVGWWSSVSPALQGTEETQSSQKHWGVSRMGKMSLQVRRVSDREQVQSSGATGQRSRWKQTRSRGKRAGSKTTQTTGPGFGGANRP